MSDQSLSWTEYYNNYIFIEICFAKCIDRTFFLIFGSYYWYNYSRIVLRWFGWDFYFEVGLKRLIFVVDSTAGRGSFDLQRDSRKRRLLSYWPFPKKSRWQDQLPEAVLALTASQIFRNYTSQMTERLGTGRPAVSWIALLVVE